MLLRINYPETTLARYADRLPPALLEELAALAGEFRGLRFVHANSTAAGGGVAEILQSLVPLMNSLGVVTERVVISPTEPQFFQVTKRIHNLLQGAEGSLSRRKWKSISGVWRKWRPIFGPGAWPPMSGFSTTPAAAPGVNAASGKAESRHWVCHIDLTAPNPAARDALMPLTAHYDGLAFSLPEFVPAALPGAPPVCIAPPAIDPLTAKTCRWNCGSPANRGGYGP